MQEENSKNIWGGKPIWMDLNLRRNKKSRIIRFEPISGQPDHYKAVLKTDDVPTEDKSKEWFKMFVEGGEDLEIKYDQDSLTMTSTKLNRTYYYVVGELGFEFSFVEDC